MNTTTIKPGNHASKQEALTQFFQSLSRLRDEGILINKTDFTCQLGEWLVETIYGGKRATSGIQKGWDVNVNGKFIQVKAHAKAITNGARYSVVNNATTEIIHELIIVVFKPDYKLKEFYQIPWQEALKHIHRRGAQLRPELNWSAVSQFKQDIDSLPRQDIIQLFK